MGRRSRSAVRGAVVLSLLPVLAVLTASAGAADPSAEDWERLRSCESSHRYDVVATHEHYGAYQFDLPTWQSVGGSGLPSEASPVEQDYRALHLYRMRGWQPWECAGILGLQPEKDGGSNRPPSREEAAYMGRRPGGSSGATDPAWPGRVFVRGDCDPALPAWQRRMNAWGHDLQGTGCYGDETERAVLALQRLQNIPETGRLGPRTWRAAWDVPR